MGSYKETLRNKQSELIRKALDGSVLIGSSDVSPITKSQIFGSDGGLIALEETPDAAMQWGDLGWLSEDGAQFSRDVSNSEVTSWGSLTPTRTDVTSDTTTMQLTAQETNIRTIGLATGFDMSTVTPDASLGGALELQKPARPTSRTYRVLSVAVDDTEAGEIYIGRFLPKAKVDSFGEQAFGGGDDPIAWGVTFRGEVDDALGYSESWLFGGPGWRHLLAAMGFAPIEP